MENNQRFFLFILLSMGVFVGWIKFGPDFFPDLFPKPKPPIEAEKDPKKDPEKTGKTKPAAKKADGKKSTSQQAASKTHLPVVARRPKSAVGAKPDPVITKPDPVITKPDPGPDQKTEPKTVAKAEPKPEVKGPLAHLPQTVKLGSPKPESGYFTEVELTSRGASVVSIQLNDKRYRKLDRSAPLKIVGNTTEKLRTFQTAIPLFDDMLKGGKSLNTIHWGMQKPVEEDGVVTGVTFFYELPDKSFKVLKRFWLEKVDVSDVSLKEAQNTRTAGYQLQMEITIENHTQQAQGVGYVLQGPVGLPLENIENARVFRGIVAGLIEDSGKVKATSMTAKELVKAEKERWERQIRYLGVDTQYFTALVAPANDERALSTIKVAEATVVDEANEIEHSDISFTLTAKDFDVPAGKSVSQQYTLYAGPKRKALLATYEAEDVIKFGFFGFFAKIMLALMSVFNDYMAIPWGFAIICLTIVVRGAMFPLSKKQAKSGRLMKELQPKIAEMKKKYGKDREKMARAQMELFSKHGYNPLAGCLPIVLQLPIFIGLYTALSTSIDLRLSAFPGTWIHNLAAPDALFRLPFSLPFLGSDFNLLPIITCVLFLVQQKMFMPKPAPDDEQAQMTHKMMTFMPIIMVFLFYRVPAGLCVYFIASSAWGIGERKLLDIKSEALPVGDDDPGDTKTQKIPDSKPKPGGGGGGGNGNDGGGNGKGGGFFGKLLAMADQAADARHTGSGDAKQAGTKPAGNQQPGAGGKKKTPRKGKRTKR